MLKDNYNRKWDSVIDCVKFYGEWLHKDIETIINKVKQCEKLSDKKDVFDSFFKPIVFLKITKPKWSMYGYDKH